METLLNPIEQRIAAGMSPLQAIFTDATCGEACWEAREDICRCSCGGKNHGCMRTADGIRPSRTAKLDGYRYQLKAVGNNVHADARALNEATGETFHYAAESRDRMFAGLPAKIRCATDAQVDKWEELAGYRERFWDKTQINADGKPVTTRHYANKPDLLWIRI